jgi:hypothetical protein
MKRNLKVSLATLATVMAGLLIIVGMQALVSTPAQASEVFVGKACTSRTNGLDATYRICDAQYDRTDRPGFRIHRVTAELQTCRKATAKFRLRAAVASYKSRALATTSQAVWNFRESDCYKVIITVGGRKGTAVNVGAYAIQGDYVFPVHAVFKSL